MLRILLFVGVLLLSCPSFAQISPVGPAGSSGRSRERVASACPLLYFGFSTGINNSVGLFGPQIDIAFTESFSVGTGFGISSWGYKFFGEGRFYFDDCNRGWALGGGVTYNTGIRNITMKDQETMGGRGDIPVQLHSQANIMLSAYRFFNLGRSHNRWHIQLGASLATSKKKFTQLAGPPLAGTPTEALNAAAPGGIIIGLGFSFGAGGRR